MTRTAFVIALIIALAAAITTAAQSGRKQPPGPSPPLVTAAPRSVPETDDGTVTPSKIESLLVTAEIIHEGYMKSNYPDGVIKEFVNAMKGHPRGFFGATKGGEMKYEAARERAKKETVVHVLWLGVQTKIVGLGDIYVTHIQYAIFVPGSGKMLLAGEVIPGKQTVVGQGGVMTIPKMPTRHTSIVSQMNEGARQIADRLKSTGWF